MSKTISESSDAFEFDNSTTPTSPLVKSTTLAWYPIENFNNKINKLSKKPLLNYTDSKNFNNKIKNLAKKPLIIYNKSKNFNNNKIFEFQNKKNKLTWNESVNFFNNKFIKEEDYIFNFAKSEFNNNIIKKDKENLYSFNFSKEMTFSNIVSVHEIFAPKFSTGIFPFTEKFQMLVGDKFTVKEIKETIENENINSYWFDNSVPSHIETLQAKVIPWGNNADFIQIAYKFPIYETSFEFNIVNLNKDYSLNTGFNFFPKTPIDEITNFEFKTGFTAYDLTFQWSRGNETITSVNIELEKEPCQVYPLHLEFMNIWNNKSLLYIEFSAGYEYKSALNLEFDDYITSIGKVNFEFSGGYKLLDDINFEFLRDKGTVNPITLEYLSKQNIKNLINIEAISVYNTMDNINMQFRRVYNSIESISMEYFSPIYKDYNLGIESQISSISKSTNIEFTKVYHIEENANLEYGIDKVKRILNIETNISNIQENEINNMEFSRVYHDKYNFNFEYNISKMTHNFETNLETLISTDYNTNINLEFLRPNTNSYIIQTYAIPWGFKNNVIQLNHIALQYIDMPIEVNIYGLVHQGITDMEFINIIHDAWDLNIESEICSIWKDKLLDIEVKVPNMWVNKKLPFEFQQIFHDHDNFDIEYNISINKDYILSLETNISINKAFELTLEYIQKISDTVNIDIEFNSVINEDVDLNIEYIIDRLTHDFNLGLEYFVSPSQDFALDIELFINTVSKSLNLELDVLDLVYYFIRKGHNILPWGYSDGIGNWDKTVNKNWDKTNTDFTTFTNGFFNQLNDKNISIPNITQYSDKTQENFGIIVQDVHNEDINISDKFLFYENLDDDYILVMGKRKRESKETIQLKAGENLIIWDGAYKASKPPMFNDKIKKEIKDYLDNAQVWDQRIGEWKTLIQDIDHPLYFEYNLNGSIQVMPFIINIKVTEDCSFDILR